MRITHYSEVAPELIEVCKSMVDHIPTDSHGVPFAHWERTPERLARYLTHLGRKDGYDRWTTFPVQGPQSMVVVPNIPFWSACSHHLLPFVGTASVGYVPHHKIIGLSKIPLLVRSIAKGFWVQEDLTQAIIDTLDDLVEARGIAVQMRAQHTCQLLDVGPPIPWMVTTALDGVMLHNPSAKQEFLEVCRG